MASGTVLELHRWPVKSMAGEPVEAFRLDGRGVAGDRTHALYDTFRGQPRRLTAREAPRLLAWAATYPGHPGEALDPADPPAPMLRAPGDSREWGWEDPELPAVLAEDLGREVELRSDPAGQQDLHDSVLITMQATLEAVSAELREPLDLRRFRTNVHVQLDAAAFAEEAWEGRTIRIGDAELELLHPCERCVIPTRDPDTQEKWGALLKHLNSEHSQLFGINARARGAATIRAGDPVEIV